LALGRKSPGGITRGQAIGFLPSPTAWNGSSPQRALRVRGKGAGPVDRRCNGTSAMGTSRTFGACPLRCRERGRVAWRRDGRAALPAGRHLLRPADSIFRESALFLQSRIFDGEPDPLRRKMPYRLHVGKGGPVWLARSLPEGSSGWRRSAKSHDGSPKQNCVDRNTVPAHAILPELKDFAGFPSPPMCGRSSEILLRCMVLQGNVGS
jgi:hypothetical protein